MTCPDFRAWGLCGGSRVVESGCGTVAGRLERPGMDWTVNGAEAILALRCCVLGRNYGDLRARRAEHP